MAEDDTGLRDAEIKRILAVLRQNPKIRRIRLLGSRAKGAYQKGSDIGIVIYENIQNQNLREHIDRVGVSMGRL